MREPPEVPCPHCPVGPACPAISRHHSRYCETQDPSEPDYAEWHALAMAAILRGEKPGASPVAATIPVDSLYAKVDTCPHRDGCQCSGRWRCTRPDRPDVVSWDDCRECPAEAVGSP